MLPWRSAFEGIEAKSSEQSMSTRLSVGVLFESYISVPQGLVPEDELSELQMTFRCCCLCEVTENPFKDWCLFVSFGPLVGCHAPLKLSECRERERAQAL
ncbi:hypothetical protein EVAR_72327_1 [Eumeta japonica]|uniref:Uncharacterized protein n=1 Tax=Eumeta variegata TaxID=151549 RepID=A0A4C1TNF9_EUMVA|nr:hypothetical protein EVAR_72327_1 [Eumeta japonica]